MAKALADKAVQYLTWYLSLDDRRFLLSSQECEYHAALLHRESQLMLKYGSEFGQGYSDRLNELYTLYGERMQQAGYQY